jgi:hypothetical protein
MQSRRDILKKLGAGAAAVTVVAGSSASFKEAQATSLRAFAEGGSSEAPWPLLSPVRPGSSTGGGWIAQELSPVRNGASILTLSHHDGHTAEVHICARRGSATGVARTHLLDLVLMDGGQGAKPTDESLGRVLRTMAKRVAKNELAAMDSTTLDSMARMLTHNERLALYGPETMP